MTLIVTALETSSARVKELEKASTSATAELSTWKQLAEEADTARMSIEKRSKITEENLVSAAKRVEELSASLERAEQRFISNSSTQAEMHRKELMQLHNQLADSLAANEAAKALTAKNTTELQKIQTELQQDIVGLKRRVADSERLLSRAQGEAAEVMNDRTRLQTALENLQAQSAKDRMDLETLRNQLADRDNSVVEHQRGFDKKLALIKADGTKWKHQNESLSDLLELAGREIEVLKGQGENDKEEIQKLLRLLSEMETQTRKDSQQISELTNTRKHNDRRISGTDNNPPLVTPSFLLVTHYLTLPI